MSPSTGPYASRVSRRSHRKSRLGCNNCKKRRVKCDEAKPGCTNCLRHSIECDYGDILQKECSLSAEEKRDAPPVVGSSDSGRTFICASQDNFTPPKRAHRRGRPREKPAPVLALPDTPSDTVANRPFQFTATDMALYHHFLKSSGLAEHMIDRLSRLGFVYHYVLRLLLAFSAFVIVRRSQDTSVFQLMGAGTDFYADGERHFDVAVAEVAAAVPLLNRDNAPALYAASLLIFLCSVTKGPRTGEYFAFRDDGQSGCLSLFMGVRSMLEVCSLIMDPAVITAIHAGYGQAPAADGSQGVGKGYLYPDHAGDTFSQYPSALSEVRDLLAASCRNDHSDHSSYSRALDRLYQCYQVIFSTDVFLTDSVLWPQIFGWLYMLPDSLLLDLRDRRPEALVLFSYYTVLLQVLDEVWMIHGWSQHIMLGILQNLDAYHRAFIEWPMARVGMVGYFS